MTLLEQLNKGGGFLPEIQVELSRHNSNVTFLFARIEQPLMQITDFGGYETLRNALNVLRCSNGKEHAERGRQPGFCWLRLAYDFSSCDVSHILFRKLGIVHQVSSCKQYSLKMDTYLLECFVHLMLFGLVNRGDCKDTWSSLTQVDKLKFHI